MKVSFASKDAYEPKLGFQEGYFEILDAKTQVFQYPPNRDTNEQSPAFLGANITFQRTDEKGDPLDEEPQERILRIDKDLSRMRPGRASERSDPDPEDLGDELDTVGNTVFGEEGSKINANTAFGMFAHSLEERGFKVEILGEAYMPDLIGLRGHATTQRGEKRSIGGREIEPSYLIVDKITRLPYEQAAKAPARKPVGKAAAAAAGAAEAKVVNGAPAPPATKPAAATAAKATAAAAGNEEAEALATEIITELSADLAGDKRENQKFYAMAYSRLIKNKERDRKLDAQVILLLKNTDWLAAKGEELSLFTFNGGVFEFDAVPV